MFYCNSCKQTFDGDPTRRLGANYRVLLCMQCSKNMASAATENRKAKTAEMAEQNRCRWCRVKLTKDTRAKATINKTTNTENHVFQCAKCESRSAHREWLDLCMSRSDEMMTYINNPARQERWQKARLAQQAEEAKETLPLLKAADVLKKAEHTTAITSLIAQLIEALNAQK